MVTIDGDIAQRRGAYGTGPSLYLRDPDGYVIELTAKVPGRESAMDPGKNHARDMLNTWQVDKRQPARPAEPAKVA